MTLTDTLPALHAEEKIIDQYSAELFNSYSENFICRFLDLILFRDVDLYTTNSN